MYGIKSADGYHEILKGIKMKTLNTGNSMIMTEFLLEKGCLLPEHSHACEQTGYLIKGRIKLYIDGNHEVVNPGDSWNIAGDIKHKAEVLEDSIALEVFNPVRKDYLKYLHEKDIIR